MLMERAFLGVRSTLSALMYVRFFTELYSFIGFALPSILRSRLTLSNSTETENLCNWVGVSCRGMRQRIR